MIKFLIHRPIAVIMSVLTLSALGIITFRQLPVSLLPDVQIPEVTVYVSYENYNGREFYNSITSPLIRQLRQCTQLKDINSETEDGKATIKLEYEYGTDANLAALEVNERIDRIMGNFPDDMERPKVIKASLTDIPVFYINLTFREDNSWQSLPELGELVENVIRKRIEQLPEVAFVDITGTEKPEIMISPDEAKMLTHSITPNIVEETFNNNNLIFGAVEVADGNYQYQIRFETRVLNPEDIKNLYLNIGGKLIQMSDVADVKKVPAKRKGIFTSNGKNAVSMAIIKQADAKIANLDQKVREVLILLENQFPQIHFEISQDQTSLLSYAIQNLEQSLTYGLLLSVLIVFAFMTDWKLPLLIGLSVPLSVFITVFFLKLAGLSLNILSLSGLILGLGMMIDNSIIVIDNISQFRERHLSLDEACIKGTNQVIMPLLSSVLTTCIVFVPLGFLSGLAGGLFFEQAVAVSIGLSVSFWISIILLPCCFFLVFKKKKVITSERTSLLMKGILYIYEKTFNAAFRYKSAVLVGFVTFIIAGGGLFGLLKKEKFPQFEKSETYVSIVWNEEINIQEIQQRTAEILSSVEKNLVQYNVWCGIQDYRINKGFDLASTETKIYIRTHNYDELIKMQQELKSKIHNSYNRASVALLTTDNLFDNTFNKEGNDFEVRIYPDNLSDINKLAAWLNKVKNNQNVFSPVGNLIGKDSSNRLADPLGYREYLSVSFNPDKLILYDVNARQLAGIIRAQLNSLQIGNLNTASTLVPVIVGGQNLSIWEIIQNSTVQNAIGVPIPLRELVDITIRQDFRKITSGLEGEYIAVGFDLAGTDIDDAEAYLRSYFKEIQLPFKYSFSGLTYQLKEIMQELFWILLISLLLLFFVLTAQFESLTQPLIILVEIPIDVAGVLLMLYLFGESFNVMSCIGIIVISGIVINDSILKVDTYNRLIRKEGWDLLPALKEAGKRRLRPILMTSLTTILAMLPLLFGSGMGVELQKPLAIAIIGGLGMGTLVSIYFIPFMYWLLYRKKSKARASESMFFPTNIY